MSKTIFITGASRGFGKIWAEAFLKRGDQVAGTSRNIESLAALKDKYGDSFLPLALDVNSRAQSFEAVQKAIDYFGTLDVVINNAGYGVMGAVEEISEEDARALIDTNVLGTLWVTQAVLPLFRQNKKGHVIQLSSALGVNTLPTIGLYSATKYAVEALGEALQLEVKEFGIHVTLLEPNGFTTDFNSSTVQSKAIAAYDNMKAEFYASPGVSGDVYGDPNATVEAVFQVVDSDNPPHHFFLGNQAYPWTQQNYVEKLATWEAWKEVSAKAQGK